MRAGDQDPSAFDRPPRGRRGRSGKSGSFMNRGLVRLTVLRRPIRSTRNKPVFSGSARPGRESWQSAGIRGQDPGKLLPLASRGRRTRHSVAAAARRNVLGFRWPASLPGVISSSGSKNGALTTRTVPPPLRAGGVELYGGISSGAIGPRLPPVRGVPGRSPIDRRFPWLKWVALAFGW